MGGYQGPDVFQYQAQKEQRRDQKLRSMLSLAMQKRSQDTQAKWREETLTPYYAAQIKKMEEPRQQSMLEFRTDVLKELVSNGTIKTNEEKWRWLASGYVPPRIPSVIPPDFLKARIEPLYGKQEDYSPLIDPETYRTMYQDYLTTRRMGMTQQLEMSRSYQTMIDEIERETTSWKRRQNVTFGQAGGKELFDIDPDAKQVLAVITKLQPIITGLQVDVKRGTMDDYKLQKLADLHTVIPNIRNHVQFLKAAMEPNMDSIVDAGPSGGKGGLFGKKESFYTKEQINDALNAALYESSAEDILAVLSGRVEMAEFMK